MADHPFNRTPATVLRRYEEDVMRENFFPDCGDRSKADDVKLITERIIAQDRLADYDDTKRPSSVDETTSAAKGYVDNGSKRRIEELIAELVEKKQITKERVEGAGQRKHLHAAPSLMTTSDEYEVAWLLLPEVTADLRKALLAQFPEKMKDDIRAWLEDGLRERLNKSLERIEAGDPLGAIEALNPNFLKK